MSNFTEVNLFKDSVQAFCDSCSNFSVLEIFYEAFKDFPSTHKGISKQIAEIFPIHFTNKASDTIGKFSTKVLPVDSFQKLVCSIYNSIHTGTNSTSHQIPVDVINHTVKCLGKCTGEFSDVRAYVIPVNEIIKLLHSPVNAVSHDFSKTFPVFSLKGINNGICHFICPVGHFLECFVPCFLICRQSIVQSCIKRRKM